MNKAMYRELCPQDDSLSIFQQDWWLDAVWGDDWDVAIWADGNTILAAWPYCVRRKYGLLVATMPLLTQTLGPWIRSTYSHNSKAQAAFEREALVRLIAQLPRVDLFAQNLRPSIGDWLPLYWNGFSQYTRYTYAIDVGDLERAFAAFDKNRRTRIRKLAKTHIVRQARSVEEFWLLNKMTFERQGLLPPYTLGFLRGLEEACSRHNRSKILVAEDQEGNPNSAIYLVWDGERTYLLMSGSDPRFRKYGAKDILVWKGLEHAHSVSRYFDFEGSMIERIERYNRSFGAVQQPYFSVRRVSRRMQVLEGLRTAIEGLVGC